MPRQTPARTPQLDPEVEAALAAMSEEELRGVLREALVRAEDPAHARLADLIIASAACGVAGWKPRAPSESILDLVAEFVQGAVESGVTEPRIVDAYLRQGTRAYLAGEHTIAKGIFHLLLRGLADRTLTVGPEVWPQATLSVGLADCFAQYLVTILTTNAGPDRLDAFYDALIRVAGIVPFAAPLASVEDAAMRALPELDEMLPQYLERLRSDTPAESIAITERAFWLREAVLWAEGEEALTRLGRSH